jgi:hypothetical protein
MTPDGAGCLLLAITIAIPFGLAGAGIGWMLNILLNVPGLALSLLFVGIIDGIGVATVWYWRSTPRAQDYGPSAIFCTFALIGTRIGAGTGVLGLLACAAANGLFGYAVARFLVRNSPDGGTSL